MPLACEQRGLGKVPTQVVEAARDALACVRTGNNSRLRLRRCNVRNNHAGLSLGLQRALKLGIACVHAPLAILDGGDASVAPSHQGAATAPPPA